MAIGAFRALATARTADAAHAALAAHAIPVTCCRGESWHCLTAVWQLASTQCPTVCFWEDVPGLSALRPTRGSWP